MREEIEEFKSQNGNSNFTQKEMIMGLITKVDRILEVTTVNKTDITNIKTIGALTIVTIGGIIYWIVSNMG